MARRLRPNSDAPPAGRVRLQKYLSDAGVASRRHAEELVLEGHVLVNDVVVQSLPAFVDPQRDRVVVDGDVVRPQKPVYFMVHKPRGVVCTNRDPDRRPLAVNLLPPMRERVFSVGRLDAEATGLLLMTNDGELAAQITHPRLGIAKRYRVEVRGRIGDQLPAQMNAGVWLSDGKARLSEVEVTHRGAERSVLMVTLREGGNRVIYRLLARLGHPVRDLKRVQIGPLALRDLPLGAARRLTPRELAELREAVAHPQRERLRPAPRRRFRASADVSDAKSESTAADTVRRAGGEAARPARRPPGVPARRPAAQPAPRPRARPPHSGGDETAPRKRRIIT